MPKKRLQSREQELAGLQIVEARFASLGWIWRETPREDFGIDAQVELTDDFGSYRSPTGILMGVQVKTGPSYFKNSDEMSIRLSTSQVSRDDMLYWSSCNIPVILTLCDPSCNEVYFLPITPEAVASQPLYIPKSNVLREAAAPTLRRFALTFRQSRDGLARNITQVVVDWLRSPNSPILCSPDGASRIRLADSLDALLDAYFSIPMMLEDFARPKVAPTLYSNVPTEYARHPDWRSKRKNATRALALSGYRPILPLPFVNLASALRDEKHPSGELRIFCKHLLSSLDELLPLTEAGLLTLVPRPDVLLSMRTQDGIAFLEKSGPKDEAEEQGGFVFLNSQTKIPVTVRLEALDVFRAVSPCLRNVTHLWDSDVFGPSAVLKSGQHVSIGQLLNDACDEFIEQTAIGGLLVVPDSSVESYAASCMEVVVRAWARLSQCSAPDLHESSALQIETAASVEPNMLQDLIDNESSLLTELCTTQQSLGMSLRQPDLDGPERLDVVEACITRVTPLLSEWGSRVREWGIETGEAAPFSFLGNFRHRPVSLVSTVLGNLFDSGTHTELMKAYGNRFPKLGIAPAYGLTNSRLSDESSKRK